MRLRYAITATVAIMGTLGTLYIAYVFTFSYKYVAPVPFFEDRIAQISQAKYNTETYFKEDFDGDFVLEENWPMQRSGNPNWWVSSGAYLFFKNGVGSTIVGDLDGSDRWVSKYRRANARDTSNGIRPQNIFRLVLKKRFLNFSQEVYMRVLYYEPSGTEFRNESNGVLLFNRYQDEFNLYYAGVRVDGQAVVKKKLNGIYYTLGLAPIFNTEVYNRDTNPNTIPLDTWIGIKSEITTEEQGVVRIKVFTDVGRTGKWVLVLEVLDNGESFGEIIQKAGYTGIRTDFMDVMFDDYMVNGM